MDGRRHFKICVSPRNIKTVFNRLHVYTDRLCLVAITHHRWQHPSRSFFNKSLHNYPSCYSAGIGGDCVQKILKTRLTV